MDASVSKRTAETVEMDEKRASRRARVALPRSPESGSFVLPERRIRMPLNRSVRHQGQGGRSPGERQRVAKAQAETRAGELRERLPPTSATIADADQELRPPAGCWRSNRVPLGLSTAVVAPVTLPFARGSARRALPRLRRVPADIPSRTRRTQLGRVSRAPGRASSAAGCTGS